MLEKGAGGAFGAPRCAYSSTVIYKAVTKVGGFFGRQYFAKRHFDFIGVFAVYETEAVREPYAVRIDDHSGLVINIAEDYISGFTPNTGEAQKSFHIVGDYAAEFI